VTRFAKRNAVGDFEKFSDQLDAVILEVFDDVRERALVVGIQNDSLSPADMRMRPTVLACITVALEDGGAPQSVLRRLAETFLQWRYSALPVPVQWPTSFLVPGDYRNPIRLGACVMAGQESRDSVCIVVGFDFNNTAAPTLTDVFSLLGGQPDVEYAFVLRALPWVVIIAALPVSLDVTTEFVSVSHAVNISHGMEICKKNRVNCWKPLWGNQQPSRRCTFGRFRDYWSGLVRLITRNSARRESDDIVRARSNAGQRVQSLRWLGASITVDQYCPSGYIFGINSKYVYLYISTLPKYQFGQHEAHPASDCQVNGGEVGGTCDGNPEPSRDDESWACVETMGHPLVRDEEIVRATVN
jgi:hypothetical protein